MLMITKTTNKSHKNKVVSKTSTASPNLMKNNNNIYLRSRLFNRETKTLFTTSRTTSILTKSLFKDMQLQTEQSQILNTLWTGMRNVNQNKILIIRTFHWAGFPRSCFRLQETSKGKVFWSNQSREWRKKANQEKSCTSQALIQHKSTRLRAT